jgi:hypothetical protein
MTDKQAHDIMHAIISASHTAYCLRNIKHLSHITRQREQNQLKKLIKGLTDSMLTYEHQMERIDKKADKSLEDVYNFFYEFLDEVSKVQLYQTEDLKKLLLAYQKDPKSINGIVNKIL